MLWTQSKGKIKKGSTEEDIGEDNRASWGVRENEMKILAQEGNEWKR